jgi:hypothetical protein
MKLGSSQPIELSDGSGLWKFCKDWKMDLLRVLPFLKEGKRRLERG